MQLVKVYLLLRVSIFLHNILLTKFKFPYYENDAQYLYKSKALSLVVGCKVLRC